MNEDAMNDPLPTVGAVLLDLLPAFLVGLIEQLWQTLRAIWQDPSSWSLGAG